MTPSFDPVRSRSSLGRAGARLAVAALAVGIVFMHGLADPAMGHAALSGGLAGATHVRHEVEPDHAAAAHRSVADHGAAAAHRDRGDHGLPCDHGDCGSHSSDMAMIGCAVAVLSVAGRARRSPTTARRLRPFDIPLLRSLASGPEPPVPRIV